MGEAVHMYVNNAVFLEEKSFLFYMINVFLCEIVWFFPNFEILMGKIVIYLQCYMPTQKYT